MAFGSLNGNGRGISTMSEINMVPLIDVMLVLLVIFMITAPMMTHSVVIDLPQVSSEQVEQKPDNIDVAIDAEGQVFWDGEPIATAALPQYLQDIASLQPQPNVHLRADRNTRYETIAEVLGAARRAGLKGLGFVTLPARESEGAGGPAQ